jgi:hypothetical protein
LNLNDRYPFIVIVRKDPFTEAFSSDFALNIAGQEPWAGAPVRSMEAIL